MLIHIVKTGETVDRIIDSYRILKSDLISNNLHITDFSHLKSGMKLKIPLLSKDNIETLEETEAFIDDYYPSFEKFLNNNENLVHDDLKEENKEESSIVDTSNIDTTSDIIEVYNNDIVIENIQKENIQKENKEDKNIQEENKKEENKPRNNNVFIYPRNVYNGNVIPNINSKYIKKI